MTIEFNTNVLSFVGNSWSAFPPHDDHGYLNIVGYVRGITSKILSVCLTQQGEDYQHPTRGLAPMIFDPLSSFAPQYWVLHVQDEILKWVTDIETLYTEVVDYEDYKNRLATEIQFIPKNGATVHTLTWGWYAYLGAIWDKDIETFREGVLLDGEPFYRFR